MAPLGSFALLFFLHFLRGAGAANTTKGALLDLNGPAVPGRDFSVQSFSSQGATLIVSSRLTITGLRGPVLWATVQLRNTPDHGRERLQAQTSSKVNATWSVTHKTLTLRGPAPVMSFETALRTVRYVNKKSPRTAARRFAVFTISNGDANATAVSMISVIDDSNSSVTTPCSLKPCKHGGQCTDVLLPGADTSYGGEGSGSGDGSGDSPDRYGFICFCTSSWTGTDCSIRRTTTSIPTTTTSATSVVVTTSSTSINATTSSTAVNATTTTTTAASVVTTSAVVSNVTTTAATTLTTATPRLTTLVPTTVTSLVTTLVPTTVTSLVTTFLPGNFTIYNTTIIYLLVGNNWHDAYLAFIIPILCCLCCLPLLLFFLYRRDQYNYHVRVVRKDDSDPLHPMAGKGCVYGYEVKRGYRGRYIAGRALHLYRGRRYTFRMHDVSRDFPFYITYSDVGGENGVQEYVHGVHNSPSYHKDLLTFTVPHDAPSVLYYQCTKQKCMGNIIYITDEGELPTPEKSLSAPYLPVPPPSGPKPPPPPPAPEPPVLPPVRPREVPAEPAQPEQVIRIRRRGLSYRAPPSYAASLRYCRYAPMKDLVAPEYRPPPNYHRVMASRHASSVVNIPSDPEGGGDDGQQQQQQQNLYRQYQPPTPHQQQHQYTSVRSSVGLDSTGEPQQATGEPRQFFYEQSRRVPGARGGFYAPLAVSSMGSNMSSAGAPYYSNVRSASQYSQVSGGVTSEGQDGTLSDPQQPHYDNPAAGLAPGYRYARPHAYESRGLAGETTATESDYRTEPESDSPSHHYVQVDNNSVHSSASSHGQAAGQYHLRHHRGDPGYSDPGTTEGDGGGSDSSATATDGRIPSAVYDVPPGADSGSSTINNSNGDASGTQSASGSSSREEEEEGAAAAAYQESQRAPVSGDYSGVYIGEDGAQGAVGASMATTTTTTTTGTLTGAAVEVFERRAQAQQPGGAVPSRPSPAYLGSPLVVSAPPTATLTTTTTTTSTTATAATSTSAIVPSVLLPPPPNAASTPGEKRVGPPVLPRPSRTTTSATVVTDSAIVPTVLTAVEPAAPVSELQVSSAPTTTTTTATTTSTTAATANSASAPTPLLPAAEMASEALGSSSARSSGSTLTRGHGSETDSSNEGSQSDGSYSSAIAEEQKFEMPSSEEVHTGSARSHSRSSSSDEVSGLHRGVSATGTTGAGTATTNTTTTTTTTTAFAESSNAGLYDDGPSDHTDDSTGGEVTPISLDQHGSDGGGFDSTAFGGSTRTTTTTTAAAAATFSSMSDDGSTTDASHHGDHAPGLPGSAMGDS